MDVPDTPSADTGIKVLLVDTLSARLEVLRFLVESPGVDAQVVATAYDLATAVAAVEAEAPNLVLLEIQLPVELGLEILAGLHERFPQLRMLVCSFRGDSETQARALSAGATAYFVKPVTSTELRVAFAEAAPLAVAQP